MRGKIATSVLLTTLLVLIVTAPFATSMFSAVLAAPAPLLDPTIIPKYVNQLTSPPPAYVPEWSNDTHEFYTVAVTEFDQQVLPDIPGLGTLPTTVWGYGGETTSGYVSNQPGPTFEATRDKTIIVRWQNKLTDISHLFAVDPTLHWANPNNINMIDAIAQAQQGLAPPYLPGYNGTSYPPPDGALNPDGWDAQFPVPLIPHLHGGEVQSTSDGHPDAWFTAGGGTQNQGDAYNTLSTWWDGTPVQDNEAIFEYPNTQPPTTLWYHDHALGITRINVMSGLAGFYNLRDPDDPNLQYLPSIDYEMPLVIQDRTFETNGQFHFPSVGLNPEHPYWLPEFFGDTIMVNGLIWPNMDVSQGVYRFRLLDGSNARFYNMSFWIPDAANLGIPNTLPFTVIGSDGGYIRAPATVNELTMAPGERWDILVDFSALPAGTKVIINNTAGEPFPFGLPPDSQTVGQIMQFTVQDIQQPNPPQPFPSGYILNPDLDPFPSLPGGAAVDKTRQLTLIEKMGPGGPLMILLDGKAWGAPISENVFVGTTEEWIIVNPTADAHPIHLHLVQFQVLSRQPFDAIRYRADWDAANPTVPVPDVTINPPYQDYLLGTPVGPAPFEEGWKDTVQAFPDEVTVIRARFAPIDGTTYDPVTLYPFDSTVGPGYVWHCHILDHEDNEMMRPYVVIPEFPSFLILPLFIITTLLAVMIYRRKYARLGLTSKC